MRSFLLLLAVVVTGATSSNVSRERDASRAACRVAEWRRVRTHFYATHPAATAQDFYKLAHQGTMGSEHAVGAGDAARAWMARELASLPPAPTGATEALVEALPPDGRFVRVHLRPYVARGLDTDALLAAFIRTANTAATDSTQLRCALEAMTPESAERAIFARQRAKAFDAVHHSEAYERAYQPAYRVVSAREAERLLASPPDCCLIQAR